MMRSITLLSLLGLMSVAGCASSSGAASNQAPTAAVPDDAAESIPDLAVGQSKRGIVLAVIGGNRSLTVEIAGEDIAFGSDKNLGAIIVDGRRVWMNYDLEADFVKDKPSGMTPGDYLDAHMAWRFDAEWAEMFRTIEMSRKIRAGEQVDENTRFTTHAPSNVHLGALPDNSPMLAWEADLQKATGVVKNDNALAVMVYRVLPLERGVVVFKTEVKTVETKNIDEVRGFFDGVLRTVTLHDGPLDFERYAEANEIRPLAEEEPESEPSPRHTVEEARDYCAKGEMPACTDLGFRYFTGVGGVEKDMKQAKKFLTMGCDGNVAHGCFGMAGLYANGFGVDLDLEKAATFLDKACELGLEEGCKMRDQLKAEMKK